MTSEIHDLDYSQYPDLYEPYLWKRGGICCYDGHAELMRDIWPTQSRTGEDHGAFRGEADRYARFFEEFAALSEYAVWISYGQRGIDPRQMQGEPVAWPVNPPG